MYMYVYVYVCIYIYYVTFFNAISVAWAECWTTGSWRSWSVWRSWVQIPAGSTIIYQFLCGFISIPCARASKLNQQICISPVPGCSSKLTTQVLKLTPVHSRIVSCPVSLGLSLELRFFLAISVAWSVRAGQLAAGGVASVWRSWVWSPPGPRTLSVPLWVYMRFPVPEHQN